MWQSFLLILCFSPLCCSLANAFKISIGESGSTKTLHTVHIAGYSWGFFQRKSDFLRLWAPLKFTYLSLGIYICSPFSSQYPHVLSNTSISLQKVTRIRTRHNLRDFGDCLTTKLSVILSTVRWLIGSKNVCLVSWKRYRMYLQAFG